MVVQTGGPVVVLNLADGEDLGARFAAAFPHVVRLSARAGSGGRDVQVLPRDQLTVKRLVAQMRLSDAYYGIVPASLDPVRMIADFLSEARPNLQDGYPGFVLVVGRPGTTYRRAAVVVDPKAPITTGSLALAAVGFAWRTGVSLDVLMLGGDPADPPADWSEASAQFSIGEDAVLLEQALALAGGLRVSWIPLGESAARDDLVLAAVRGGGYDIVLDDLRPIDVGPRFGRLGRVRRALVGQDGTDTAYRLVRDAQCDVAIVVDAVHMSLLPANAAKTGAMAALSLGMLGVAAPTLGGAPARASTSGDVVAEAPLEPLAEAAPLTATVDVHAPTAAPPPVEAIPGEVTPDELAGLQAAAAQQAQALQQEQDALDRLQQEQAAADADAWTAGTAVAEAEAELLQAQRGLADAEAVAADAGRGERDEARSAVEAAQEGVDTAAAQVEAAQAAASAARTAAQVAALDVSVQAQNVADFSANTESWSLVVSEAASRTDLRVTPTQDYRISATFGQAGGNWSSGFHTGLDFAAPEGTPVFAAADGVVVSAGWGGAFGNHTVIEHRDGTTTHYAHQAAQSVQVGEHVVAGQQIGTVGSTGNSTGPHLHFEVRSPSGQIQDPAVWLQS